MVLSLAATFDVAATSDATWWGTSEGKSKYKTWIVFPSKTFSSELKIGVNWEANLEILI